MEIVPREITLADDMQEAINTEVAAGRFASESEFFTVALYWLFEQLEREGNATPEMRGVLARPLEALLAEFRQAWAEKSIL